MNTEKEGRKRQKKRKEEEEDDEEKKANAARIEERWKRNKRKLLKYEKRNKEGKEVEEDDEKEPEMETIKDKKGGKKIRLRRLNRHKGINTD